MFPPWLRKRISVHSAHHTEQMMRTHNINTVCEQAKCPNKSECFSKHKATFLILGNTCTRKCSYCAVSNGMPERVDLHEPERVAEATSNLNLQHVVITSVTRDDLPDGGAGHFVKTVHAIKSRLPHVSIEVLTPDFEGNSDAIANICSSDIDIFNHNLETVREIYPEIRPAADYERSLHILRFVHEQYPHIFTKSGLMVGLGENEHEVFETIRDLRNAHCDIITIGQYLKPSPGKHDIMRFVSPDEFTEYEHYAKSLGCMFISSGPFVRSSYNADSVYAAVKDGAMKC